MNIYDLLDEHSHFFEKRIKLQKKIMKINEKNMDNLKTFLINSNSFKDKNNCRFLLDTISSAFYARPKMFDLLINIIETFKEDIQKHFTSDDLFFEFFTLNITRFKLYQKGLINISTFSKISEIDDETILFFAPEIKELFENHPDMIVGTHFENKMKRIEKIVKDLENKNAQRPTTLTFSNEQISKIIETDSISEFQRYLSQTNLSIDSKIKLNSDVLYILPSTEPSLIEYSMFFNSIEIFKFLMLNNAKIDNSISPCFAIAGGSYDIIHILEKQNLGHVNSSLFLNTAIRFHRNKIANYLADTFAISFDFEALTFSIRYNNYDAFVKSVPSLKENPNERGSEQETVLYTCVNFGRLEFLKFLTHIDGIDFNVKSIAVEWSPLHLAASYNQLEMVKYLCLMTSEEKIKKQKIYNDENEDDNNENTNENNDDDENNNNENKNINNENNNNENKNSNNDNINENIYIDENKNNENGNNNNENDNNNDSLIEERALNSIYLLDDHHNEEKTSRFIDVNVKSVNMLTPLHIAASNGFKNVVSFLCSLKSVDVNAKNSSGEVPLHFAALGNLETMKALCSRKEIDVNAVNSDGETPLFFAIKRGNVEMVRYLLSLPQINKDIASRNGQTPTSLAQKRFSLYKTEKCWEIYKMFKEKADQICS